MPGRETQSRWVHLDVAEIKCITDKAMLVEVDDDDGDELWLPLSQIADADCYKKGDRNVTVSITKWLAEQKEIGVNE